MASDSRSVLTRAAPAPSRHLRYGDGADQLVDVWLPGGDRPAPLVIFLHGGFWRHAYDRSHCAPLAADLARRGYAVATPEYRRTGAPGGGWPGTFDDVAAAVAAIPALLATDGQVSPGPTVLAGHSAGGHLALWAPTVAPDVALAGVLALAPVADLGAAYELDLDDGAVVALLGGGPDRVPERYAATDPVRRLPVAVPVRLVHGDADPLVPVELSRRYVRAARAADCDVSLTVLPGTEHFGVIDPLSTAWPSVIDAFAALAPPRPR